MSAPNFLLHVDDSPSVSVGSPKLSRGDRKSCGDPKIQHPRDVHDEVADKDIENVKRKGKEKVLEHGSDNENAKKKKKVKSQDIPCESIPKTVADTVPATPDDVDDTKAGDCISRWILTINRRLTATPIAMLLDICIPSCRKSSLLFLEKSILVTFWACFQL